ncbi:hypothetical protein G7046_g8697 [Stylonectria norvegica]|nr:hypothetical protein G7046_g8697 [Stylonectria norvegica]
MSYKIVGKTVGDIGFGLMSLTTSKPITDEAAFNVIKTAINSGCNYFNGGEFYGPPTNNSLTLLNKYFAKYPEDADKVVLNIKGGIDPSFHPDGSVTGITASIENSLKMLGPLGRIHQYEPARKDPKVDYDETLGAIDAQVKAGKIDGISVSEVNATTLRNAAKKFKITALETEVSLFCLDTLNNGTLEACAELGIPVLAYSPLGKGFLGGQFKKPDDLPEGDFRKHSPQFSEENFYKNLELVKGVEKLAAKKGVTSGQIAINWLLALSKRPGMPKIIPIPGSQNADRVKENSKIIELTDEDLAEIEELLASFKPAGTRYAESHMTYVNA